MNNKLATREPGGETALANVRTAESGVIMRQLEQEGVQIIPAVDQPFRYQLPRLGKLHLGVKVAFQKKDKKTKQPLFDENKRPVMGEYPKATEYFVLPDELLSDTGFMDVLKQFNADPTKPTKIPVMLPCNAIGGNVRTSCDLYGSSKGLLCRTLDGINCERVNQVTGEWTSMPCAMHGGCQNFDKKECHWIHRIRVVVPDAMGIGVWQIDTTSPNNRATLFSEMGTIKAQLGGKLAGIDLFLTLEPREFQIAIEDYKTHERKLTKTTAFLMHLRSALSLRNLQQAAKEAVVYDESAVEWDETIGDEPIVEVMPAEPLNIDLDTGEIIQDAPSSLLSAVIDMEAAFDTPQKAKNFRTLTFKKSMALEDMTEEELQTYFDALIARDQA